MNGYSGEQGADKWMNGYSGESKVQTNEHILVSYSGEQSADKWTNGDCRNNYLSPKG